MSKKKIGGITEVIVIQNKTTGAKCIAAPGFKLGGEPAWMIKDRDLNICELENYYRGKQRGYDVGVILGTISGICFAWAFSKLRKARKHRKEMKEEE